MLCLPILVISVQQNAVNMTLPPFLDAQRYPVATIGTLLSLAPIFTLAARVPGGMLYRRGRTTARMAIALLVVAATSALYSLADSAALFVVVGAFNGFATSIATTLYLPFFIDELPAGQARPQAMGLYTGSIALGFAIGGLGAGYAVDHRGYTAAFVAEGIVALAAIALHAAMAPAAAGAPAAALPTPGPVSARASLRNLLLPEVTSILLAALFLNVLYKIPSTFIPLYGQHRFHDRDRGAVVERYGQYLADTGVDAAYLESIEACLADLHIDAASAARIFQQPAQRERGHTATVHDGHGMR